MAEVYREILYGPDPDPEPLIFADRQASTPYRTAKGRTAYKPRGWYLTPEMESLALAAYEDRAEGVLAPDRLAILADVLEEAGCREERALVHLRSPGPHYPGCWALDLILGRR